MAIYDIFSAEKNGFNPPSLLQDQKEAFIDTNEEPTAQTNSNSPNRFFSSLAARLFFFLLLLADMLWAVYAVVLFSFGMTGMFLSFGKSSYFREVREKGSISLRRSLVCGISLFIALFSPAFGIMVACTYFLMYDKSGIEEVVPSSLQSQFREFLPKE